MSTLRRACDLALALPEVTEADHHGIISFRIAGRIFATVPRCWTYADHGGRERDSRRRGGVSHGV